MDHVTRQVAADDWPRLAELRLRALTDAPEAFGSSYVEEAARSDEQWRAFAKHGVWFITEDNGMPVGLVGGLRHEDSAGNRTTIREIVSMWVHPDHRGSGAAVALINAVRQWAITDGASALELGVADGNERARRFYERIGFAATGERRPLRNDPARNSNGMRLELR